MKYGIHRTVAVNEGGTVETFDTGWRIQNGVGQVVFINKEFVGGFVKAVNLAAMEDAPR